ncbi:MAG: hypothetical protein CCU27_01465 [Nitrospira sp. UW-LDO-02]|nr:MAG: hypothetical protein CCU27_01465 [Nitrospira sp. UW-LDO-02]
MSLTAQWDSSPRQRTSLCWAFSMTTHGLFVGLAMVLLTELPPPPPPTFKWDVAVVQSPPPAAEPAPPPPVESQPPPTPQPPTPKQVQPVKPQPVVRPIQPTREVQPVQHIQPVQESMPVQTAQAIQEVNRTVQEPVETVVEPVQAMMRTEAAVEQVAVVEQQTPAVQQTPTAAPVMRQAEPVTQVATVVSDAPAVEAAPAPVEAPQQVEQAIVQRPVEAVQHRVVQQRTVQGRPEAQADFGWLAQSIFSSVDPHKRYPAEAKRNRWKGRVILKLTVEQRGGAIHLLELVLKESSGHAALDRHTVDMVRTVFPLQVKHHIARAAIDVDIPITYQLAN